MQNILSRAEQPVSSSSLPLSIVIGAASLQSRRSGVGRMTLQIIQTAQRRPEITCLRLLISDRLYAPEAVLDGLDHRAEIPAASERKPTLALRAKRLIADVPGVQPIRRFKAHIARHRELSAIRDAGGGRVAYHEPNMISTPFRGPTIVTVNDLSWHHHPDFHPRDRLDWIARNLRRTLDNASRFVAISRFTANALQHDLGVPAERIDVVPLAAAAQFRPQTEASAAGALARHGLADRSYVLSVSTLEPRKNFDRLVAAHLLLPLALRQRYPLVIAGGSGWGDTLRSAAPERARREGTLRLLGHVSDEDLVPLYARAAAFAYVSIYEGFGLPVLEAMAAGTPTLASSTTATGETAGQAASLADPMDVDAIAAGLRRILEDSEYAAKLQERGLAHAATFNWDHTLTGLIACWRKALTS